MNWDWRSWFRRAVPKPEREEWAKFPNATGERFTISDVETWVPPEPAGFDFSAQVAAAPIPIQVTPEGAVVKTGVQPLVTRRNCAECGKDIVVWRVFADSDKTYCIDCGDAR